MADCDDSGSNSSRSFDYTMLFDDVVGEILVKLDSSPKSDVLDELVEALDMSMLMDVRLKVFRFAKAKLLKTVGGPGNMDIEPGYKGAIPNNTPGDAEKAIEEWSLIARKGKQRVALDAIALLAYYSGSDTYFPHRLIKKRLKRAQLKATEAAGNNQKQALIPFKLLVNGNDAEETEESSSSSEEEGDETDADTETAMEPPDSTEVEGGHTPDMASQDLFTNDTDNPMTDELNMSTDMEVCDTLENDGEHGDEGACSSTTVIAKQPASYDRANTHRNTAQQGLSVPNVEDSSGAPEREEISSTRPDALTIEQRGGDSEEALPKVNRYANLSISKTVIVNVNAVAPTHAKLAISKTVNVNVNAVATHAQEHSKPQGASSEVDQQAAAI